MFIYTLEKHQQYSEMINKRKRRNHFWVYAIGKSDLPFISQLRNQTDPMDRGRLVSFLMPQAVSC